MTRRYEEEKTVLQLQPNNVNGFTGLMGDYLALDQIENANNVFEQARQRKLDHNVSWSLPLLHRFS